MSEQEQPQRVAGADVSVEDVRQLMGASTPHFALQIRERIRNLVAPLERDHPARMEGEREIARLNAIAVSGEVRGLGPQDGERPLPAVSTEPTET